MEEHNSLFERLGGMDFVNVTVDIFYSKVISDHGLKHFFTNVNMKTQAAKQKAFLAYAFGCPMAYTGKSMSEAHTGMNLTEIHFEAVSGHLIDTLRELNVPKDLIDEVIAITLTTKDDILGK